MKFDTRIFLENPSRKEFKFYLNLRRIKGTLHEELCSFIITSGSSLVKIKNISDKIC
jgi:hypothetical protein